MGGGADDIDDLIVKLSARGRLVRSRGLFEVDRDEAREKMQRFRLEDPHLYVIELMQAAYLLGATFVAARVEANRVTVRFDGDPLSASDLSQIYAAAFARRKTRRDQAMRHLALALGAVRGLDPSKIVIESSTIDGASRLTIMPGRADKIEEGISLRGNATTVTVRKRFRLDRLFGVWRDSDARFPERVLLQRRCGYSSLAVTLDGERLSVGKDVSELFPSSHKFKSSTEVGFVGVRPGEGLSSITLMQFGVIVDEHHFSNPLYTVRAIIESERLNQDLTRAAFIKDAAWEEFQDSVLTQEVHRALRRLLEPLLHGGELVPAELLYDEDEHAEQDWVLQMNSAWLRALALEVLRECGDMRARGGVLTGHTRALALMLESLPMWPVADKLEDVEPWQQALVSMRELGVGLDADAELAHANSQVREVRFEPGGRRVLLVRDYDTTRPLEVIQRYTQARTVDVTEYLLRRRVRHQNISLWSWRSPHPELDLERFSTAVSVELTGGVTLEIAMHRAGRNVAEWVVVHDHKMLCLSRLDGVPFPGLNIVWRGVFGVNELYDDVFVNEDIFRLALRTVDLLVEFFFDRAARLPGANRKMFLAFFELVVSGQLAPMLLRAMGMWRMEYSRIFEEWWARRSRDVTSVWWLAHLAEYQARSDAELLRARQVLGPLGQLELFESISGQRVASSEILASAIVDERLAIVHEEHATESRRAWRQLELDRTIIIADRGAERILRLLLSPRRLQVFDYELAMMAGRARYLRERERAALVEGALVIRVGIDQAGVVGQLGLLEGDSRSPGVLDASLLYLHRLLGRVELDVPFGRLSAVVNSDSLRPSKSWRSARQDEHYELVCRVLRDAARHLYIRWIDRVTATPGELSQSPALLEQFLRFCVVARYTDPDERLAERAWQVRCLTGSRDGDRVSLADVVRAMNGQEDVFYVVGEAAVEVERACGAPGFVLVLPEGIERPAELLGALFPDKHRVLSRGDHARDQVALEHARARFMARPAIDLELAASSISSRRFASARRRGVIGLLDDPSPLLAIGKLSLILCHESRHVARVIHDVPIGRFEAIIDDDELIAWGRSDEVSPLARVDIERVMTRRASALLVELCQQVEREPESIDAKTRHMLRCYVWKVTDAGAVFDELRQALMSAPLFYVLGVGWRCVTQLLDDIGGSGELFYAIESWGIERSSLLQRFSSRRIILFEDDESRDAWGRIFPGVDLSPISNAASIGEDPAPRIAPEAPREDEAVGSQETEDSLRERVVALLLEVRGEHRLWLDDALVERVTFDALAGDRSVAVTSRDLVWVNRDHRVTRYAERHRADLVAVAMLASSIYSSINLFYKEITDDHERAYQAAFALRLLDEVTR